MTPRAVTIEAFLRDAGWGGAARAPLAGDASNRRYERLARGPGGAGAVLMDAPPERGEDVRPFLAVAARLHARGLSAPRILAAEEDAGLLLLEDLGDALYARVCAADPGAEPTLYAAAADLLAELPATEADALPPYDAGTLTREAALFPDWYLAAALPGAASLGAEVLAAAEAACAGVAGVRSTLVLRDHHAENLLWLPERAGPARVGLLDFQDALIGHPAYDLASLLEDARRDTSAELRAAMTARFLDRAGLRGDAAEAFRADLAVLAAQRNLKILGIFCRLWLRDGKPGYLDLLPRVWDHLQRDLAHPSLAALRGLVAHAPAPTRQVRARIRAAGGPA